MKKRKQIKIEVVHLVLVIDHPHILITTVAKRSEDKWWDEVSKFLELSLRIAMGEEDARHAARPFYGLHFSLGIRIAAVVAIVVAIVVADELIKGGSGGGVVVGVGGRSEIVVGPAVDYI